MSTKSAAFRGIPPSPTQQHQHNSNHHTGKFLLTLYIMYMYRQITIILLRNSKRVHLMSLYLCDYYLILIIVFCENNVYAFIHDRAWRCSVRWWRTWQSLGPRSRLYPCWTRLSPLDVGELYLLNDWLKILQAKPTCMPTILMSLMTLTKVWCLKWPWLRFDVFNDLDQGLMCLNDLDLDCCVKMILTRIWCVKMKLTKVWCVKNTLIKVLMC